MLSKLIAGEVRDALRPFARKSAIGAIVAALSLTASGFAIAALYIGLAHAMGWGWAALAVAAILACAALLIWYADTSSSQQIPPAAAKEASVRQQDPDLELALTLAQIFLSARDVARSMRR